MTAIARPVTFTPLAKNKRLNRTVETTLEIADDSTIGKFEHNKNFGIFRILDQVEGDKRLVWNRLSLSDISEADRMFNQFVSEGLSPYRVGGDGKQGTAMDKFDPTAEEIIFLPIKLVVGG